MNRRILIVDDMQVNRILIRALLEKSLAGLEFHQAVNGFQALHLLKITEIDLIILDLMMPEMDGFQFLQAVKAEPAWRDIPVIINSALGDTEYVEHALSEGALDYFTKPLTSDQMKIVLPLKVKNALDYYEQKKELAHWKRKLSEELKIAGVLQNSLLFEFKATDEARFYGRYLPSREIGGDFYDAVQIDGSTWFIIADVTGNGVAAALVAAMIKASFFQMCQRASSPEEVLNKLNQFFLETARLENPLILSAFVGMIRNRTMTYANAGHPYPVIWRKASLNAALLEQNGFLIGAVPVPDYDKWVVSLEAGDIIITYTDGLFINQKVRNWDQFLAYVQNRQNLLFHNPQEFMSQVLSDREDGNEATDDLALMAITIK